jgi:hypothetical protein
LKSLSPTVPFVWPDPRVLAQDAQYKDAVPFDTLIRQAGVLFGVVNDVNTRCVDWLAEILCSVAEMQSRLIVALYPACITRETDLLQLVGLQALSDMFRSVEFRVLTVNQWQEVPANMLCWLTRESEERHISFGPTCNFGLSGFGMAQGNLVFHPDPTLWLSYRHWFDYMWARAIPLTPETATVPVLVPATGSPAATALWEAYVEQCSRIDLSSKSVVMVDEDTGAVQVFDAQGYPIPSATETILPATDELAGEIARIYQRGSLVTVDKNTRLKPFETPIDPRWFGLSSNRQVGAVSRQVSYRISPFDGQTLKKLDRLRSRSGDALPKFTFPLGDGVRWMPTKAKELFAEEMKHADETGRKQFEEICGKNPTEYVEIRLNQIREDADRMVKELFPNQALGTEAFRNIVEALTSRLTAAANGPFSPKVSFANVQFEIHKDTDQTSTWGQALTLLHAIAQFPRQLMTDPFFLRGLQVRPSALLKAMNVADDVLVTQKGTIDLANVALVELALLHDLMATNAEPHHKCSAILALLRGDWSPSQSLIEEQTNTPST